MIVTALFQIGQLVTNDRALLCVLEAATGLRARL